ncbi:MAG TPA: CcdB family protein [Steroidobacteraceae bacterium]|jgi:toxin CcdB|nr:CcdB family protein [Steroidobacteraceae bacterium]
MAQFDVHRNSGKHKDTIPFVVIVQPAQFDSYRRRVVVPLVRATAIGKIDYVGFNPTFKIRGATVVLHPLEMVSIPVGQLGERVGSLRDDSQLIVAALDELLSRVWK